MKKYRYKLNEADMEQLVDAIANKVEFSDEDVQASLVGNDMVISVFDKVVLISTKVNKTPSTCSLGLICF